MADGGPPTPQPSPVIPPALPVQPPVPPVQLVVPPAQPIQPAPMLLLNWSHFNPVYAGKPDEDGTNDWMDTHAFPEGVKSPAFLSKTSRRGMIMVWVIKTYKWRLEQVTELVLTAIFQNRQY